MESFLTEAGIEMYYYDQLGVNFSDQPKDLSLWTLERYCEEVEEVRRGLGLDNFVLYGHSWGGILAMEYALKYRSTCAAWSSPIWPPESGLRRLRSSIRIW